MLSFKDALTVVYRRGSSIQGRSSRAEYWWFILGANLIVLALSLVTGVFSAIIPLVGSIFGLVSLIVYLIILGLSVFTLIRRLHDTDRSGWWALLILVPVIGSIAILIFCCIPGKNTSNRFGSDPYTSGYYDYVLNGDKGFGKAPSDISASGALPAADDQKS